MAAKEERTGRNFEFMTTEAEKKCETGQIVKLVL